mgnify:CR=1 FL=1
MHYPRLAFFALFTLDCVPLTYSVFQLKALVSINAAISQVSLAFVLQLYSFYKSTLSAKLQFSHLLVYIVLRSFRFPFFFFFFFFVFFLFTFVTRIHFAASPSYLVAAVTCSELSCHIISSIQLLLFAQHPRLLQKQLSLHFIVYVRLHTRNRHSPTSHRFLLSGFFI